MKINWKIRLKNPVWWVQMALAVLLPILGYMGITTADLTTWGALGNVLLAAVGNPYVICLALVSVWNAINDPTIGGLSDSRRAMAYTAPGRGCSDA